MAKVPVAPISLAMLWRGTAANKALLAERKKERELLAERERQDDDAAVAIGRPLMARHLQVWREITTEDVVIVSA